MNKIWISLILLILMTLHSVRAQFDLSGEFRPRAEFRHGYKQPASPGVDPAFLVSQRTRLNAGYLAGGTRFYLSIQDVRIWGDQPQMAASNDKLTLYQAWMEYTFTKEFSLKAGRQEIAYDDGRLLGNVDWAQQGRSHDALVMKYIKGKTRIDFGGAYNQSSDVLFGNVYEVKNNYKTMQYVWFHQDIGRTGISILAFNNGMQYLHSIDSVYKTVYSHTLGTRITSKAGKLNMSGALYYQTGRNAVDRKLDAMYFSLGMDYPLSQAFQAGVGMEYLSGTSTLEQADGFADHSFLPLYGTAHKYNGDMDYFYSGNHFGSVGFHDLFLDLKYNSKQYTLSVSSHYFLAAADVSDKTNPSVTLSRGLGLEFDANLDWKLSPALSALIGYSQMLPTSTLTALRGGAKDSFHYWIWTALVFKPHFFSI